VKRIGTATETAEAIMFLMTNGFMTGEIVHIDGGGRYI
jgi:NAD(P)-dependent dehydrogenase (short-subunit alcohol dehydrogenase family)